MTPHINSNPNAEEQTSSRREELQAFLIFTVVLAPLTAVACVGGYGFLVWMFQLFYGPPTGG